MRAFLLMTLALTGCKDEWNPYPDGGENNRPDLTVDDTSSSGDDTSVGEGAPVLTDILGTFEDYPNIGDVVEVVITYEDNEGDVDGGVVHLDMESVDTGATASFDVDIDGELARAEINPDDDSTVVIVAVQVPSTRDSYLVTVTIEDAGGNESNELEVTVGG